jgi:hypothetical protein
MANFVFDGTQSVVLTAGSGRHSLFDRDYRRLTTDGLGVQVHKQEARLWPIWQPKLIEVSCVRVKRFPCLDEQRSPSLALFPR